MIYLGDFAVGDVIPFPFDTYGSSGESITMTGLAVTDLELYRNGSTTQRASDNGYTLLATTGIDFDGVTGLHGFSVDTGDNSDSGFYSSGGFFWLNVNAVTINSQTVRFTYFFSLNKANVSRWLGTACATPTVAGVPEVDTVYIGSSGSSVPGIIALGTQFDTAGTIPATDSSGAALATAANQTTILARLGSWTGSGLNTILGALRAIAAKASSLTPSDISSGTTFDNTTDSLEAVRDRGDAAWVTGSGSTLTVLPLSTTLVTDALTQYHLTCGQYAGKSWTLAVYDSTGAAVSLSGKTVKVAVWRPSAPSTIVVSLTGTVGGASNNQVTFAITGSNTAAVEVYRYTMRNTTDDTDLIEGTITINPAPDVT